jgi:dihydrofolate reductase
MTRPRRIEGYAIVSREGMISDADGIMPAALKIDADQRFFHAAVAAADAVANGRHSNEGGPQSAMHPRLVLTRRIADLAPHPTNPKALLWNPAGVPLETAWARLGIDGVLAVVGGTAVFGLFLDIGYDAFFLSRAPVDLPDGRPVFPGVPGQTPEALLAAHGLTQAAVHTLDARAGVTVAEWRRS